MVSQPRVVVGWMGREYVRVAVCNPGPDLEWIELRDKLAER